MSQKQKKQHKENKQMSVKKLETKPLNIAKKTTVKVEVKTVVPKAATLSKKTMTNDLLVPIFSLTGKEIGSMDLPKEIFGKEVNKKLLAQALRVYIANKKVHTASTKTRGKVHGTTAKVWRQKGTGRARHGAKTAPIFVGGGIAFGPQFKDVKLDLPKKMKKAALINALSSKMSDKDILGVTGLEKATGKTKEIAQFAEKISIKNALIITGVKQDNVVRGVKNIPGIDVLSTNLLNAYEVLKHGKVLITKEAVEKLETNSRSKEIKEETKNA
jgi:large subunit ribosomal protein L4